ncbi:hypothetical protein FGO68_gene3318 [Halteria grandinella]|uniref:Uncharacterized protein n=1 Tax=Halteria grandinella TaxID=5974 RepID=A0A8J8NL27_HALGN|nr:hypothetical protein FGO68_gene3318 [Halteria grandinella]
MGERFSQKLGIAECKKVSQRKKWDILHADDRVRKEKLSRQSSLYESKRISIQQQECPFRPDLSHSSNSRSLSPHFKIEGTQIPLKFDNHSVFERNKEWQLSLQLKMQLKHQEVMKQQLSENQGIQKAIKTASPISPLNNPCHRQNQTPKPTQHSYKKVLTFKDLSDAQPHSKQLKILQKPRLRDTSPSNKENYSQQQVSPKFCTTHRLQQVQSYVNLYQRNTPRLSPIRSPCHRHIVTPNDMKPINFQRALSKLHLQIQSLDV